MMTILGIEARSIGIMMALRVNKNLITGGSCVKGIVDRYEGEFVVIEVDGVTKDILKADVDANVKVGDTVVFVDGKWLTDEDETKNRSKQIKKLMDNVWED
jgi:hypothetical protein